ncbi:cytochrome c [Sinirhodobacter huangdaonensis]|uniref:Cytochrome C n=1 Tax=Paenirhodobacter huangdaonensis TaxID=2501515 RepID=A0A443LNM4_9RHOB|nr:cytochrome c [Sinirhodobacter huangdaonensis]RWR50748.1 cytochrome C [Sinirhodobacter huangdaonensis]
MRALMLIAPLALAACLPPAADRVPTPAEDYASYCAGCHGNGRDPGPIARELKLSPTPLADLTTLNEGIFPEARVMSKIVGYKEHGEMVGAQAGDMPPFEPLTEGQVVLYDSGDGIPTPTPLRLVKLMEYVKAMDN